MKNPKPSKILFLAINNMFEVDLANEVLQDFEIDME
jgi:hypothetical protein